MDDLISRVAMNKRYLDWITKGLEECTNPDSDCTGCPYIMRDCCYEDLRSDVFDYVKENNVFAYIQQLEREKEALLDALHGQCEACASYNSMSGKCGYCIHSIDAWNVCEDNWEWRGLKED